MARSDSNRSGNWKAARDAKKAANAAHKKAKQAKKAAQETGQASSNSGPAKSGRLTFAEYRDSLIGKRMLMVTPEKSEPVTFSLELLDKAARGTLFFSKDSNGVVNVYGHATGVWRIKVDDDNQLYGFDNYDGQHSYDVEYGVYPEFLNHRSEREYRVKCGLDRVKTKDQGAPVSTQPATVIKTVTEEPVEISETILKARADAFTYSGLLIRVVFWCKDITKYETMHYPGSQTAYEQLVDQATKVKGHMPGLAADVTRIDLVRVGLSSNPNNIKPTCTIVKSTDFRKVKFIEADEPSDILTTVGEQPDQQLSA